MNKRRWVAFAIAIDCLCAQGVFVLMAPPANEESSLDGLNALYTEAMNWRNIK